MNFQIFIIIRFCINFNKSPWNFNILNYRIKLFEYICLPSILSQSIKNNLNVIIIISEDLPIIFKIKLFSLIKNYDFIHIHFYDGTLSSSYIKKYIKNTSEFIVTVRLDDDDGINSNYIKKLLKYCIKENINKLITFENGFYIKLSNIITYKNLNIHLIAVGLALILPIDSKKTVYCGNHHTLFKKYNIIVDKSPNMWIVSNHKYGSDNRFRYTLDHKLNSNLTNKFPFIKFFNLINI